jgi:hypothetical protein
MMLLSSGLLDLVLDRSLTDTAPPDRFLRARKFDLGKAEEMLLSAEQWRKDFGVDEIMEWVISSEHIAAGF